MMWSSFFLVDSRDDATLRRALGQVFSVPTELVTITRDGAGGVGPWAVHTVLHGVRGHFRCMVDVYLADAVTPVDELEGVKLLCRLLGSEAMASDDSVSSYSGVHIDQSGNARPASFDPDAFDREEYRLQD